VKPTKTAHKALLAFAIVACAPLTLVAVASPTAAVATKAGRLSAAVVQHDVKTAGRYDVRVSVTIPHVDHRAVARAFVEIKIGDLLRSVETDSHGSATLTEKVQAKKGRMTIRATEKGSMLELAVKVSRVRPKTKGSTGSKGATGSTGAPAAATPTPAPLTAHFAANGAPILTLPAGFAAITNYTTPVKDYEFNGSALPADWTAAANTSHGMNTNYQPSQVTMTGSAAALTAINQPSGGQPTTSGWISTEGTYSLTHGLIDFSAQMPAGQGLWSGLWLDQPDNSNPWGEIDVSEMLLGNTQTTYGSLHSWAPSDWGELQSTNVSGATTGYNDYQVAWQPGLITWAVNGIAFAQYTQAQAQAAGYPWPFDDGTGFFLIANLAVGTSSTWGGAPNSSTVFPSSVLLKSVKIWQ
jgi:beta-glucanase (GH16 family)